MDLALLLFVIAIAAVVAELEIQIEGEKGWAGALPTWRINNKATSFILGGAYHPLTGYHFFLGLFVITFFHFPFVLGLSWSGAIEFKIIAAFSLFWLIEDFLWFVFNPSFGISRFKPGEIPWHQRWIWRLPFSYYKFFLLSLLFYTLSLSI